MLDKITNIIITILAIIILILIGNFLYTTIKIQAFEQGKKIESEKENTVTINCSEINKWEMVNTTDKEISQLYFYQYLENLLYYPKEVYEQLEEEYKKQRFKNELDFQKYIENSKQDFKDAILVKYQVIEQEKYKMYICVDQNENYYIFKETSPMQYTVILDDYTLILPQFIKKYNSANTETKIAMQVDRVRKALNNQDYNFVYSKLANSFKQNYFKEQTDLENYAKNNFYKINEFQYVKLEAQDNNYIYTIQIIDGNDERNKQEKTFVIHLKEEGDFEFSFSV